MAATELSPLTQRLIDDFTTSPLFNKTVVNEFVE